MKTSIAVEFLLGELKAKGIEANIYKLARSGSCYIRFKDKRMGQCRVGDHDERSRYGYRWQIRGDITESYEDNSKGHRQFYFPFSKIDEAIARMEQYYQSIQSGKYTSLKTVSDAVDTIAETKKIINRLEK